MQKKWKERSRIEKMLLTCQLIVFILVLGAALLQLLGFWKNAVDLAIPLLGLFYLLDTPLKWKADRDQAAFSLIIAVFSGVTSFLVFFL